MHRPEVTDAIISTALEEFAEKGYGRMSMEAVAKRAGVGKSAVYRRWPSKQALAVDAMSRLGVPMAEVPDTGSLRGDLRALLRAVLDWLDEPRVGRILPDLVAEARRNQALADALTAELGDPRRERGRAVLERAVARGEIPADTDHELILDLLAAPVFWHLSVRRLPVTQDYLDRLLDTLLRAMTAPRPGPEPSPGG
ncbi:TetR/AcrR family transcriptional regulator [Streptomyces capparidis]